VDLFRFEAKEQDAVFILLTDDTKLGREIYEGLYPKVELLGPDGKIVNQHSASNSRSGNAQIDQQLAQAGTYTLRVSSSRQTSGPYVLAFSQLSEVGGTPVSATSMPGVLASPGDVALYVFNAIAGDAVVISLSDSTEGGGGFTPNLELFSPDGNELGSETGNYRVNIDLPLAQTGKYTIRVRDSRFFGGPYILAFSLVTQ